MNKHLGKGELPAIGQLWCHDATPTQYLYKRIPFQEGYDIIRLGDDINYFYSRVIRGNFARGGKQYAYTSKKATDLYLVVNIAQKYIRS